MTQIPRGPEHLYCPLWRKKMSKVCHTCPLWEAISMQHPQTGEEINEWRCSLAWRNTLQIKHAQIDRQVFHQVEDLRNRAVGALEASAAQTAQLKESVERLVVGIAEAADRGLLGKQEVKVLVDDRETESEASANSPT